MLAEIRQLYEELNKFWAEEVLYVGEALNKYRFDRRDLKRWNNFNSRLRQATESWKVWFFFYYVFPTDPNIVFRIGHQTMMLKPYAAIAHPLRVLQFVHSPLHIGVLLE